MKWILYLYYAHKIHVRKVAGIVHAYIKQKGNDLVIWETVADLVGKSSWVFDGRNIVDGIKLRHLGFKVHSVRKGLRL